MEWQYTPYSLPLAASTAASLALGLFILRRRHGPGSLPFAVLLLSVTWWTACYSLEMASASLAAKVLFSKLLYLGVVSVPSLWLLFALQYSDRLERLSRVWALLVVEPLVILLLSWSDSTLVRTLEPGSSTAFNTLAIQYGPWFWVHVIYSYVLLLLGALLLGAAVLRSPFLYRRQTGAVLIGALAPWAGNALHISGLSPFPGLDLTPLSFLILGAAVGWGLFRFRLLDIVPVARESIIEDLADGIIVIGERNQILDINPAASVILGCSPQATIGRAADEVLSGFGELAHGVMHHTEFDGEFALGEGSDRRLYEVRITSLHERQRLAARLVFFHDITRRKQTEDEMIRSQRLRAAGELALGISHNLNNLLTGVMGPAGLIREGVSDPQIQEHADTIAGSVRRASDLIKRLASASRHTSTDSLQPVSVADAIQEALTAARPRWKDEPESRGVAVDITTDVEAVPNVAATPGGLQDVLLNLLFNCVDAMPDGGVIAIFASRVEGDVELRVRDTGIGMDDEVRSRVFEPFFTTKPGIGFGLGLSTLHTTISQWGGHVEVKSAPGEGTTFVVRIPMWVEADQRQERALQTSCPGDLERPPAPARVLVIEDETTVRTSLAALLGKCGHEVEIAESGEEALALFQEGVFHVALIDLGMPGMSGDALARALRDRDPGMVRVLMTGWVLDEDDPRCRDFDLTMLKPVGLDAIRETVSRALDLRTQRRPGAPSPTPILRGPAGNSP